MNKQMQAYPSWQIETKKAEFMEWLYTVYERDTAPLGLQGTYTGLWQQFQHDLATMYRDGLICTSIEDNMSIADLTSK